MARLEEFRPILKPGRLTPHMGRILFETEKPFDQIVLPIELTDLLVQCNGEYTLAEIIENIYHQKGSVQFKLIVRALQHLRDRGFLENGNELELPDDASKNHVQFLNLKPSWSFPLGKRIFNDHRYPNLFYVFSMLIIITSILTLQKMDSSWLELGFLKVNGSYLNGLIFFFVSSSFILSFKNIVKTFLQVFLTGRAYNFGLCFNGYAVHFSVTSDALFLVQNKFYMALIHLASFLSPIPIIGAIGFFMPDFPFSNKMFEVVCFILLMEANPFEDNDFNQFLRTAFPDDSFRRIASFFKQKPFASVIQVAGRTTEKTIAYTFNQYSFIWTAMVFLVVGSALQYHFNPIINIIQEANLPEQLGAYLTISLLGTWFLVAFTNELKLIKMTFISPVLRMLRNKISRKQSKKIDYFNQAEVLKLLETLPLFSYFPQELLNMLLQKSQVLKFEKGSPIILQGDDGRELFVLLSGLLEIRKRQSPKHFQKIGEVYPPSIFGEIAILEDCKRRAEVIATQESVVLSVPAKILRQAAQENRYIRELEAFKNAIMVNQFFTAAPFFRDLPERVVHLFTSRGKIENIDNGKYVFNQGEPGDGFFLILRGTVGVTVNGKPVGRITQGGFFGEISLIADVPRTGSIIALENLVLLRIGRESFWEILSQDLRMATFIESVGEHRIKEDIEILCGKDAKIA